LERAHITTFLIFGPSGLLRHVTTAKIMTSHGIFKRFDWKGAWGRYEQYVRAEDGCVGLGDSDVTMSQGSV
jgi:hypothetical protein